MAHFVLEIGVEEMPARFLSALEEELATRLDQALTDARLDHGLVRAAATPRRLVVEVEDVAPVQAVEDVEVLGPPAAVAWNAQGELTKAGQGFARSQSVEPHALYRVTTAKGEYAAARKTIGGGLAQDILAETASSIVKTLSFPKRMQWVGKEWSFGRPVRWILALLDEVVVPVRFAQLAADRCTWGHRVLGPGPWSVPHARDFRRVLEEQGAVILDPAARRATIIEQGDAAAQAVGGRVAWNDDLLAEVVGLVESPCVVLGSFDASYLEIPEEVLLTSMQAHQKSFGVRGEDGALVPYFLAVANIRSTRPQTVRAGWERVLRARLEDARFFWRTDLAADFAAWNAKLENVTFLGPLGSMADKTRRLERILDVLDAHAVVPGEDTLAAARRAAQLCKADLVSAMVYEFGELQGIMGGIYARRKGESDAVALAIREHYLPLGPDTPVPASLAGAMLALADKADTLVGAFGLGMIPTGAADPYALRRASLGIIRILLEHELRVPLSTLLQAAYCAYGDGIAWKLAPEKAQARLMDFFGQRLKAYWAGQGMDTLTLDAALAVGFDDVVDTGRRVRALQAAVGTPDFEPAALTFKRVANIVRKSGAEAAAQVDPGLLEAGAEAELWAALEAWEPRFASVCSQGDYGALFPLLAELRPAVDRFFDSVMVLTDHPGQRGNRLAMLSRILHQVGQVADFTRFQV